MDDFIDLKDLNLSDWESDDSIESVKGESKKDDSNDTLDQFLTDWESSYDKEFLCHDHNIQNVDFPAEENQNFDGNFIEDNKYCPQNEGISNQDICYLLKAKTLYRFSTEQSDAVSSIGNDLNIAASGEDGILRTCKIIEDIGDLSLRVKLFDPDRFKNFPNSSISNPSLQKVFYPNDEDNPINDEFCTAPSNNRSKNYSTDPINDTIQENPENEILKITIKDGPENPTFKGLSFSDNHLSIPATSNNNELVLSSLKTLHSQRVNSCSQENTSDAKMITSSQESNESPMITSSQESCTSQMIISSQESSCSKMIISSQGSMDNDKMITSSQENFSTENRAFSQEMIEGMIISSQETGDSQNVIISSQETVTSNQQILVRDKRNLVRQRIVSENVSEKCKRIIPGETKSGKFLSSIRKTKNFKVGKLSEGIKSLPCKKHRCKCYKIVKTLEKQLKLKEKKNLLSGKR